MLTTCPNCQHLFHNHGVRTSQQLLSVPAFQPCCETPSLLVSATLQLPPHAGNPTCTLAVTASTSQPLTGFQQRTLAGMAGGGIVLTNSDSNSVILQDMSKPPSSPQPSPSTPLSFILPSTTNVFTRTTVVPFPWPQWGQPVPQVPQSDTDLVRLGATMRTLRNSGWYYEGLSWQESAELLQATSPGTFLVRDSSDPRFLFSLSVQTDRGPTSVRLFYIYGQFRLDAEPRLAPLMPLFECVVKLVEYYIAATKNSRKDKTKNKEQVWVDARGHVYSHILLTSPLYKKQQLPSLQHLSRLAINKQLNATSKQNTCSPVSQLPLPPLVMNYLHEYPYTH